MTREASRRSADIPDPGGHHRDKKSEPCRSHLGIISELNYADLVQAKASAGACQEQTNSIGQHLQYDDPPRVGNFNPSLFSFDGVGENFRDFLVA